MKINLEINNITQSPVEDAFFVAVTEKTLAEIEYDFLEKKEINISLALVAKEKIRRLNKEHRQYDSVTDILSFAEYGSIGEIEKAAGENREAPPAGGLFLGELILCYDDIKEYAEKEGVRLEKELAKVVSHGILHLLSFAHGEKMFAIQEEVAESVHPHHVMRASTLIRPECRTPSPSREKGTRRERRAMKKNSYGKIQ